MIISALNSDRCPDWLATLVIEAATLAGMAALVVLFVIIAKAVR